MSLLVAFVLPDVVQVVPANDYSPLHLHALHDASQDAAPDRHVPSERALLVNVCPLDSLKNRE